MLEGKWVRRVSLGVFKANVNRFFYQMAAVRVPM